ncbi:UDP-glycosyltransferase 85A5-like [Ipomoea triloba]|uniref:UDP-glycosyltransferase 85A5-like n=1 Tax=Ipomoea triloba TaxID=35885 RepID=UPI00125D1705|nr:UDP-glycosyltransferase 85A5-like [Ipomoea triloba]
MEVQRPHAVCIPYPTQGHIHAMLKLAKLLHHRGFHITYVLTQLNYTQIMKARNFIPLSQSPTFRFETIPNGLPSRENPGTALDITELYFSTAKLAFSTLKKRAVSITRTVSARDDESKAEVGLLNPVTVLRACSFEFPVAGEKES